MHFLGQLSTGIYIDEHNNVHPEVLQKYLGTSGDRVKRHRNQTGAGHSVDEEEWSTMVTRISEDQQLNVRHEGVTPPLSNSPFHNATIEEIFFSALRSTEEQGLLPNNYRIRDDEWEGESYPVQETIQFGRGSRKHLEVELPIQIWKCRAERWCRAHSVMVSLQTRMDI